MAQRQFGELLDAGHGEVRVVELVDDLEDGAAFSEHGGQRIELGGRGPPARHRAVGLVDVDEAGRQTHGAGVEALPEERGHGADLVGRGWTRLGLGSHHVHPQHGVADERRHIEGDVGGEHVEPGAEALAPAPVDTSIEGGFGHLLDETEHAAERVALIGPERRE